ncbi:MAG TPA: YtxH domain-containing protein [Thermodesulfobacteriota bacterium]|jgi:gas vesicle protein|nr:YtxH domain-containing protein [Thermodesulfobacteriota bacterium]
MGKEESRRRTGPVMLAFFIGGLVGAGVALLLAPRAGRETRQKIKELAEQAKEKATEYAEETKNKVASIATAVEAVKDAFAKQKEKLGKI